MSNEIKITNEEMDELLGWIKASKTLQQVGRLINKKYKGQPLEDEEPKRTRTAKQETIDYRKLADAIASKEPIITLSVECSIGNNKKIILGGAEPLSGRDFMTAHSDLYLRLLGSIENIVSMSTI